MNEYKLLQMNGLRTLVSAWLAALDGKEDMVPGKMLSDNDYTDTLKARLDNAQDLRTGDSPTFAGLRISGRIEGATFE